MKTKIKKDALRVFETLLSQGTGRKIYCFGNGGSAAIANHMAVDWVKNSNGFFDVRSLSSNSEMLMMIANDYGYDQTGSLQLDWINESDGTCVFISSSGNSRNVISAANQAKIQGHTIISFTGFNGGELKKISDVRVHIKSNDYGICEDYHSQVMHEVARLLKKNL